MSGFGDNVENAVLNVVFRGIPYPYSSGTRLSLHTADPTDAGLFEAAGLGYARQTCTWGAPVNGVVTLISNTDFNNLPAGTYQFFGVWTVAGDYVGCGTITVTTLANGDSFRVDAGTTFSLS